MTNYDEKSKNRTHFIQPIVGFYVWLEGKKVEDADEVTLSKARKNAVLTVLVPVIILFVALYGVVMTILNGLSDSTIAEPIVVTRMVTQAPAEPIVSTLQPTTIPHESASKLLVEQITVPATANRGTQFIAPQSGEYVVQYLNSAWYPYDVEQPFPAWATAVLGFRGSVPQWVNDYDINDSVAAFTIGTWENSTERAAITSSFGEERWIDLQEGEILTFIVGDARTDFDDNSGEVLLAIFLIER